MPGEVSAGAPLTGNGQPLATVSANVQPLNQNTMKWPLGVSMSGNRAVAYKEPGVVEIIDTDYPTFELKDGPGVNPANVGRKVPHGAILRTVTTNICGSDQHMVRGRTTAPRDLVLGHEITGEVVEVGPDVEFIKVGDIVSVPFNIS